MVSLLLWTRFIEPDSVQVIKMLHYLFSPQSSVPLERNHYCTSLSGRCTSSIYVACVYVMLLCM